MSESIQITADEIEALAARLDALEGLDAADRATLAGVFAFAGQAAASADDAEVSGFAQLSPGNGNSALIGLLLPAVQKFGDGSVRGSFSWGVSLGAHGGGGGAGKVAMQDFH